MSSKSETTVGIPDRKENTPPHTRPEHHCDDSQTLFKNPWESFNSEALKTTNALKFLSWDWRNVPSPSDLNTQLPVDKPDWNIGPQPDKLKATWLSHASFLVELPAPPNASRGVRVLFDPVFSAHCADFGGTIASLGKTRRRTGLPSRVKDLQDVDLVLISHNHYDHMDLETISRLQNQFKPLFVVPLNNEGPLLNLDPTYGKPSVEILDWWQSRIVKVDLPNKQDNHPVVSTVFEVTCVPSQHQSNRTLFDRNHSLWSGYTVTSVTQESQKGLLSSDSESKLSEELPELLKQQQTPFSCFFAGDTGYAYSQNDDVGKTRCPAFKQIGKRFGGFDLALLPIGAYDPRDFTSGVHASPEDSVEIFKDVRARFALAMHWGTFALTNEPILQPRERLRLACEKDPEVKDKFRTCRLGETVVVDIILSPDQ